MWDAETQREVDRLMSEFTIQYNGKWQTINDKYAYQILKGQYGARGVPGGAWSWEQKYGIYPKVGFFGDPSKPFGEAFMNLKNSDIVRLSRREAKFHMIKYLFAQKGGMGRRFQKVYGQAIETIEGFETDLLWYDNIITNTEAWKEHIHKAAEYVSQHAGGIVGDHIKEHYFSSGKREWAPLSLSTLKKKKIQQRDIYSKNPVVKMPYTNVPMWGITGRNTNLPDSWHNYTYKHAGWPRDAGKIMSMAVYKVPSGAMGPTIGPGRASVQRTAAFLTKHGRGRTMRTGAFIDPKQYVRSTPEAKKYGVPYSGRHGTGRMYAPVHRASLMDIVAYLNPKAAYKNSPRTGGRGHVSIGDIIEPFAMAPWVFNHETGFTTNRGARVPARAFIGPGLKDGVNDASRLFREYIKDGTKGIRKGINLSGASLYRAATTDALYGAGYWARIHAKYAGSMGIKKDQYTTFTSKFDVGQIMKKVEQTKKQTITLFDTRYIWYFLPPSKYYHYVGMAFDIGSIVGGGFWSLGAVQAWVQAMATGMAGARMGTPVPFTTKARRRKFRKGLYTKAGYHRQGALGSGR